MNLIFLDLELNKNEVNNAKVIQIGAVAINLKSGELISSFNRYVNPGEQLDPYIVTLTGITQDMVDSCPGIDCVLPDFWAWVEQQPVANKIVAWGNDIEWLKNISNHFLIDIPRLRELDLKEMTRWFKSARGLSEKGGLSSTLKEFGLDFVGRPHNALDDALNTGRLGVKFFSILRTVYRLQVMAKDLL